MRNSSVYQINKGINASIEFKGLKAQYIWYMGGAAIVLFAIYALLYVTGIRSYICIGIVVCLGTPMTMGIYHLSGVYGAHGVTKLLAKRSIPKHIKSNSRSIFKSIRNHGKIPG